MHYLYLKAQTLSYDPAYIALPNRIFKILPFFFFIAGSFLLASATVPILAYQFFVTPRFTQLARPVPDDYLTQEMTDKEKVLGAQTGLDMTQPSNWFPTAPHFPLRPSKITNYGLSIPRLKIQEANVTIAGEDLKKSLVHYPGTALPGQFGNAVVFGHSTLPQLFNPKNYTTIFATLPTLGKGDEILVDFDGIRYKYVIEEMFEVKPDDISVLEQRYDDSYLTLITCVPPGTYMRRLIVRSRLKGL